MSIKYEVSANPLKPNAYYPRALSRNRVPMQRLIDDIVSETTLTETDARAVINALQRRVVAYLLSGQSPELEGLVSFSVSLSEDLPGANASASNAATIRVNARPAADLQKIVRNQAQLERVYVRKRVPLLTALFDVQSGKENVYTAGNIARLHGDDLKFNLEAADEGIFFTPVGNGKLTRVATYAQTGMREVTFLIPADLSGEQHVELHTRFGGETLRIGRLLTVVTSAS